MVVVFPAGLHIQIGLHRAGQGLEEVLEHLRGNISHVLAGKLNVPHQLAAAAEIQQHQGPALVHGKGKAVAVYAPFVPEGPAKGLSEGYAHILYGVVLVHLQIPFAG